MPSPDMQSENSNTTVSAAPHPGEQMLALYSRKDLGWRERLSVGRHVRSCPECGTVVEKFQVATADLRREAAAQTLTGFESIVDWNRLEQEMLGNIRVGVSAARCIDHVGRHGMAGWRVAVVTLGLLFVFVAGWALNIPRDQSAHLTASLRRMVGLSGPITGGSVVSTTPMGIAVRAQGGTLMLLSPSSKPLSVRLSGASAVTASYVDAETGQITITNVYGQ